MNCPFFKSWTFWTFSKASISSCFFGLNQIQQDLQCHKLLAGQLCCCRCQIGLPCQFSYMVNRQQILVCLLLAQTCPLKLPLFKEGSEASSCTKAVLTGFGCSSPVSLACNKPFTRSWHCKMPSGLGAHCLEMCSYAPKFFTKLFCSSKTDSNTSGSTHGLLKCLAPPLPDLSFCKGKAATLFAKSLFAKTGPSGLLIFCKVSFCKGFFQRIFFETKMTIYGCRAKLQVKKRTCVWLYMYILVI